MNYMSYSALPGRVVQSTIRLKQKPVFIGGSCLFNALMSKQETLTTYDSFQLYSIAHDGQPKLMTRNFVLLWMTYEETFLISNSIMPMCILERFNEIVIDVK